MALIIIIEFQRERVGVVSMSGGVCDKIIMVIHFIYIIVCIHPMYIRCINIA